MDKVQTEYIAPCSTTLQVGSKGPYMQMYHIAENTCKVQAL